VSGSEAHVLLLKFLHHLSWKLDFLQVSLAQVQIGSLDPFCHLSCRGVSVNPIFERTVPTPTSNGKHRIGTSSQQSLLPGLFFSRFSEELKLSTLVDFPLFTVGDLAMLGGLRTS